MTDDIVFCVGDISAYHVPLHGNYTEQLMSYDIICRN